MVKARDFDSRIAGSSPATPAMGGWRNGNATGCGPEYAGSIPAPPSKKSSADVHYGHRLFFFAQQLFVKLYKIEGFVVVS